MRLYTMSEYLGLGENCQETHKCKDIYRTPLKESEWGWASDKYWKVGTTYERECRLK